MREGAWKDKSPRKKLKNRLVCFVKELLDFIPGLEGSH